MKFILQLICIVSPYTWSHRQTLPSQGKSFAPSQAEQLPKLPCLFLLTPLFWGYLNSQVRIKKKKNGKQFWLLPLPFKTSCNDTSFHIFVTSLWLYLSPECLLNFLLNIYVPPFMEKYFKFMEFTSLETALIRGIFTHALSHS